LQSIVFDRNMYVVYQNKKYSDALTWYKLSQRLATHAGLSDQCLAKLHRNIASTHLCLTELSLAHDDLERAEQLDSTSPHLFYLQFKLAVLQNDQNAGTGTDLLIYAVSKLVFCFQSTQVYDTVREFKVK